MGEEDWSQFEDIVQNCCMNSSNNILDALFEVLPKIVEVLKESDSEEAGKIQDLVLDFLMELQESH